MKYIRTKDRIVNITDTNFARFCEFKIENNTLRTHYYCESFWSEEEIIAQAETIEELCDGIFVEDKNNPNVWFLMELDEFAKEKKENNHLKEWNYLGFIKTDKGLIYVAKMNDKGELELL